MDTYCPSHFRVHTCKTRNVFSSCWYRWMHFMNIFIRQYVTDSTYLVGKSGVKLIEEVSNFWNTSRCRIYYHYSSCEICGKHSVMHFTAENNTSLRTSLSSFAALKFMCSTPSPTIPHIDLDYSNDLRKWYKNIVISLRTTKASRNSGQSVWQFQWTLYGDHFHQLSQSKHYSH